MYRLMKLKSVKVSHEHAMIHPSSEEHTLIHPSHKESRKRKTQQVLLDNSQTMHTEVKIPMGTHERTLTAARGKKSNKSVKCIQTLAVP